jgi:hypothetical protein
MKPDEAGSKNHVCKRSLTDLKLFIVLCWHDRRMDNYS